jgi:short subunit dehydrogenase-like uncharacterized protein
MTVLIYGANGYTGALTARRARSAGFTPILAGRNATQLQALADELGLSTRVFALTDQSDVDDALQDVDILVNAVGHYPTTGPQLLEACLRTGTHYLDFAGEVPFFEHAWARDEAARAAGITVLPGVGFGVVATDLLAMQVAALLPAVDTLDLAFRTRGGVSRGTASVLLPTIHQPGVTRIDGSLVLAHPASRTLDVDFGKGRTHRVVLNPWRADLVTAALSTGARTVTVYQQFPAPITALMRPGRLRTAALNSQAWQGLLSWVVRRLPPGPGERQLADGSVQVWARATHAGQTATAVLDGPEAYEFTALAAVAILRRMTTQSPLTGFQTPATAFGTGLLNDIHGVSIRTMESTPQTSR